MSLARGQNAFVCIRCQVMLAGLTSSPLRQPISLLPPPCSQSPQQRTRPHRTTTIDPRRSYSTTPHTKKGKRKSEKSEETQASGPQPVTWTSLLQTKTLGESRSVLVLRDLEKSRSPQLGRELTSPSAKDIKPDEILASLSELKNAEGQEEVNRYIDGLRPSEGEAIISKDVYEELLQKLTKSFDAEQLERYRLIVHGEDEVLKRQSNQDEGEKANGQSFFSERTTRSDWQPYLGRPSRGKKSLMAAFIIRQIWQCKVQEERFSTGRLTVFADEDSYHLLLFGGANSVLSSIGQNRSVKIDASLRKEQATLHVFGEKEAASEAADDIERLLMGIHKLDFNLSPFKKRSIGFEIRNASILSRYSQRCKSIIEVSPDRTKLIITSISKSDAEETRRTLLQSLSIPSRSKRKLLASHISKRDGALWPVESDDVVWNPTQSTSLGRFGGSFSLSTKARDIRTELLKQSCIDRNTTDQLRRFLFPQPGQKTGIEKGEIDATAIEPVPRVQYGGNLPISVDFGSILHPLDQNERSNFSDKYQYTHHLPGMRQMLYHFSEAPQSTARFLTIIMRPSPWGSHGFKTGLVYPTIRITFRLEQGTHSRRLDMGRIEAIQERREAHILLPKFPADLRFSRENTRPMDSSQELQAFMLQVQQSLLGYGHLSVPSLGEFPVSRILEREESLQAPLQLVEYYTSSAELSESIRMNLWPYELVYSRLNSVPPRGEQSESLSLKTILQGMDQSSAPSSVDNDDDTAEGHADPFEAFVQKSEEMVKTLTRNVGEKFREDMVSLPSREAVDALEHPSSSFRLTSSP